MFFFNFMLIVKTGPLKVMAGIDIFNNQTCNDVDVLYA